MTLRRAPSADWPRLLTPALGCLPPIAEMRHTERVVHVALHPELDALRSMRCAFASISMAYAEVDYLPLDAGPGAAYEDLVAACRKVRPTIIFMQVQRPTELANITAEQIAELRRDCSPDCVIVLWDGDYHGGPGSGQREWFRHLGRLVDTTLTVETRHQEECAALGIRHPGYLQTGNEPLLFHPVPVDKVEPAVVLVANNWAMIDAGYAMRQYAVCYLTARYGSTFQVYGSGWFPSSRPIGLTEQVQLYSAAAAALSVSIRSDVARCTSDRLLRMLGCGSLILLERFPDCEGLGLEDGVNCLSWSTCEELQEHIDRVLADPAAAWCVEMRRAAAELSREHTWGVRMRELLAIVDAVRGSR